MGTTADRRGAGDPRQEDALTPERRLDAIADIFARGLARLVLAEAAGHANEVAASSQPPEIAPESTLIDGAKTAVMVSGAGRRGAAKGGRAR